MQATVPTAQPSSGQVARDLAALFAFIQRSCGRDFLQAVDELDMSLTQVKALHWLWNAPDEHSVKALARQLGISLPAASRAVEGLHQRALVERREDDEDRRMKRVRITPAGSDVVRRVAEARHADVERFVSTLSDGDRKRLAAALAPLLARDDVSACAYDGGARR